MLSSGGHHGSLGPSPTQGRGPVPRSAEQVTTDGHTSYPKAVAEELGTDIDRRSSQDKNNVLEQDHGGVKGT